MFVTGKEAPHMKITTCYSVALKAQMTSKAPGKQKDADAFSGSVIKKHMTIASRN